MSIIKLINNHTSYFEISSVSNSSSCCQSGSFGSLAIICSANLSFVFKELINFSLAVHKPRPDEGIK